MDKFKLTNFQQAEKLLKHRFIFDKPSRVLVVSPRNEDVIGFLGKLSCGEGLFQPRIHAQ